MQWGKIALKGETPQGALHFGPVQKPALWNGDDQGNCRGVRREGTTLQERMYHKWTLFVKYFLQTEFRLKSARFLRHATWDGISQYMDNYNQAAVQQRIKDLCDCLVSVQEK
jgi:hypothetical protein